jgi:cytochrome P450
MTTVELPASFYGSAPMADGRAAACRYWRRMGGVYRAGDLWFITSHDGVRFAQKHPELFSSARAFDALSGAVQLIPLAVDPPDHAHFRRILDPMLGPRRIDRMEGHLRAQVRAHIDAFATRGTCDVVADLAYKFPTQAILTLFGLPHEHLPQFLQWVSGLIKDVDVNSLAGTPSQHQIDCSVALFGFLQEQVALKREHPGDDMLSDILSLTGDDAWTDAEVLGLCFLFMLAGLDTVTGAIGFALLNLAGDTALRRRLTEDPSLIPPFVEEVLRLDGPVPGVPRVTTAQVLLEGVTIPAGARVMLLLSTANREGPRTDNPHQIDLGRKAAHLAFGGGIHRCLGSHLARRELRLTIEEFHARIPDYRLAGEPIVKWPSGTLHLSSLPLEFPPSCAPVRSDGCPASGTTPVRR